MQASLAVGNSRSGRDEPSPIRSLFQLLGFAFCIHAGVACKPLDTSHSSPSLAGARDVRLDLPRPANPAELAEWELDQKIARLVYALGSEGAGQVCTATHYAPHVLLTAEHCDATHTDALKAPFWAAWGQNSEHFRGQFLWGRWLSQGAVRDIALVEYTDEPLQGAKSEPFPSDYARILDPSTHRKLIVPHKTRVLMAGYGFDERMQNGTLRRAYGIIESVNEAKQEIMVRGTNASVCNHDSGGPVLLVHNGGFAILGVLSTKQTENCTVGSDSATYTSTTFSMDFIKEQMNHHANPKYTPPPFDG
jgi:V8-like Glu-specific endopeptidase